MNGLGGIRDKATVRGLFASCLGLHAIGLVSLKGFLAVNRSLTLSVLFGGLKVPFNIFWSI